MTYSFIHIGDSCRRAIDALASSSRLMHAIDETRKRKRVHFEGDDGDDGGDGDDAVVVAETFRILHGTVDHLNNDLLLGIADACESIAPTLQHAEWLKKYNLDARPIEQGHLQRILDKSRLY